MADNEPQINMSDLEKNGNTTDAISANILVVDDTITLDDAEPGTTVLKDVATQETAWEEFPDEIAMRARIFSIADIPEEVIPISEWKMDILVRGMNGKTRAKVLQNAMNPNGTPNMEKMYPDLVINTARHPITKKLIFSPADREALNEKSGGVLEKLAMAAARLSGLDTASQELAVQNFQKP